MRASLKSHIAAVSALIKDDVEQNSILDLPPSNITGPVKERPKNVYKPKPAKKAEETPFKYDAGVLSKLRPDQVPRFLGALTHPPKQTKTLDLDSLVATQNRIDPKKVEAMRENGVDELPTVVRFNETNYIADGHHRLTAAHMDGDKTAKVRFKDISERSNAMKGQAPFQQVADDRDGIPTEETTWPPTDELVQKKVKRLKKDGMFATPVTWRSAIDRIDFYVRKAARGRGRTA